MTQEPAWKPSRREQRADWYLKQIFRLIGAGGVVYMGVRGNSAGMLSFAIIGGGPNVLTFAKAILWAAVKEIKDVEDLSDDVSGRRSKR